MIVGTESAKVYAAGATTRKGILLRTHPHLMSGICRLLAVRWSLVLAAAQKGRPESAKKARELYALERRAMFTELMQILREGQGAHQPVGRYPGGSPTYRPTS